MSDPTTSSSFSLNFEGGLRDSADLVFLRGTKEANRLIDFGAPGAW